MSQSLPSMTIMAATIYEASDNQLGQDVDVAVTSEMFHLLHSHWRENYAK